MSKLLTTNALLMLNCFANFVKILEICKDFAGNRVMNSEICPDGTVVFYIFRDVELKWCPASGLRFYADPACTRQQ